MKILFTISVLVAGIYLFLPNDTWEQIKQYLPQHKIEKAAENLLNNVDDKLEQFKTELLQTKDHRINELEQQLATLQAQFIAKEVQDKSLKEQHTLTSNEKGVVAFEVQTSPLAQTQYISSEPKVTLSDIGSQQQNLSNSDVMIKHVDKQKVIKIQASLQDIAQRMNETSLLALTH